jgi:NADH:ubiquinone oxidoreductase subunit H
MGEFSLYLTLIVVLMTLYVVLVERKFLAYAQRRLGPVLLGRNGIFQIIFDLVKLVTKEIFLIPRPSSLLAPIFLSLLFSFQLAFSQHFIFGFNLFLFYFLDSLILLHLIMILMSNIFFSLTGLISQSRYAIIGTVRGLVHIISLDIFITIIYSLLVLSSQSPNFHEFVLLQNSFFFMLIFIQLSFSFFILLILEAKRTPFDHAETESEVVAGYSVEYSGPMLMMFYLAEYLHLVISSIHFVIFFLGGWLLINFFFFLQPCFILPNYIYILNMII